jgi:hypothetical protein
MNSLLNLVAVVNLDDNKFDSSVKSKFFEDLKSKRIDRLQTLSINSNLDEFKVLSNSFEGANDSQCVNNIVSDITLNNLDGASPNNDIIPVSELVEKIVCPLPQGEVQENALCDKFLDEMHSLLYKKCSFTDNDSKSKNCFGCPFNVCVKVNKSYSNIIGALKHLNKYHTLLPSSVLDITEAVALNNFLISADSYICDKCFKYTKLGSSKCYCLLNSSSNKKFNILDIGRVFHSIDNSNSLCNEVGNNVLDSRSNNNTDGVFRSSFLLENDFIDIRKYKCSLVKYIPKSCVNDICKIYCDILKQIIQDNNDLFAWAKFFIFPKCILRMAPELQKKKKFKGNFSKIQKAFTFRAINLWNSGSSGISLLWEEVKVSKKVIPEINLCNNKSKLSNSVACGEFFVRSKIKKFSL